MSEKEVVSAVKYVSRMKQEFMLSEIREYIKDDVTTGKLFDIIAPMASGLGLKIEPVGGDYKVARLIPAKALVLGDKDRKAQEKF